MRFRLVILYVSRLAFVTLWLSSSISCSVRNTASVNAQAEIDPQCSDLQIDSISTLSIAYDLLNAGEPFGGISGLAYNPGLNAWLAISDSKGDYGPTRLYQLKFDPTDLALMGRQLAASFDVIASTSYPGKSEVGLALHADAEAIRVLPGSSDYIWASEGDVASGVVPSVYRFNGRSSIPMQLPQLLQASITEPEFGPRANRSFEGLDLEPPNDLWVGLESPLIEDGNLPTVVQSASTGIYRVNSQGMLVSIRRYLLDPIPVAIPGRLSDNGLAELLRIDSNRMLIIERAGVQQSDESFHFSSRLYCARWQLVGAKEQLIEKHLLAVLSDDVPAAAGNFESIASKRIEDSSSLFVVAASDNNFAPGVDTFFRVYVLSGF